MACDPSSLTKAARCFLCLDRGQIERIKTYLSCRWAQGVSPSTGNFILLETGFKITLENGSGSILLE